MVKVYGNLRKMGRGERGNESLVGEGDEGAGFCLGHVG